MPSSEELIAHNKTVKEIAKLIGADWLVYPDLDELVRCSFEGNSAVDGFECSVFDGKYVTGDVDESYLNWLEKSRNDRAQALRRRKQPSKLIDLQDDF